MLQNDTANFYKGENKKYVNALREDSDAFGLDWNRKEKSMFAVGNGNGILNIYQCKDNASFVKATS